MRRKLIMGGAAGGVVGGAAAALLPRWVCFTVLGAGLVLVWILYELRNAQREMPMRESLYVPREWEEDESHVRHGGLGR